MNCTEHIVLEIVEEIDGGDSPNTNKTLLNINNTYKKMKLKITMIFLFIGLSSIAQSTFKKGYFIDNDGVKKEVFFMSHGKRLPHEIIYKEKQNSLETKLLKKTELSELKVEDIKFLKKEVSVEFLDKNMVAKKENNTTVFKLNSKQLLLRVLLEFNDFTLYSYYHDDNDYFFVETKEGIELLKYKKITKDNKKIQVRDFRKQLLTKFKVIDSKNQGKIGAVKYKERDFVSYFLKYAVENNYSYKKYNSSFVTRDFKDAFNITPKLGYSLNSQSTKTKNNNFETSFDESQISFGVDIEYFFNSTVKKSSLILSYTYHNEINSEGKFSFASLNDSDVSNTLKIGSVHFKYRQYFRLLKQQYVFANVGVLSYRSIGKTKYTFIPTGASIANLEYSNDQNEVTFSLGLGYSYNNVYLELNYIPKMKGIFDSLHSNATTDDWLYDRSLLNFSIGYAIF